MSPADHPSFPVDRSPATGDPLVDVLIAHQRHGAAACLCGPLPLGSSHAAHVAERIREATAPVVVHAAHLLDALPERSVILDGAGHARQSVRWGCDRRVGWWGHGTSIESSETVLFLGLATVVYDASMPPVAGAERPTTVTHEQVVAARDALIASDLVPDDKDVWEDVVDAVSDVVRALGLEVAP